METQKCEFHKIKVAKAREKFVRETALSKVIYRDSLAAHFRCSSASSTMEGARPPLYLLPPNKFY